MTVMVESHEGRPIGVALPDHVTLEIVEADPVVKGQTAASSYKPAKLENGVRVMVPRVSLPEAREALAEVEAVRPTPEEIEAMVEQAGGEEETPRPTPVPRAADNGKTLAIVVLGAAVVVLGWLYL